MRATEVVAADVRLTSPTAEEPADFEDASGLVAGPYVHRKAVFEGELTSFSGSGSGECDGRTTARRGRGDRRAGHGPCGPDARSGRPGQAHFAGEMACEPAPLERGDRWEGRLPAVGQRGRRRRVRRHPARPRYGPGTGRARTRPYAGVARYSARKHLEADPRQGPGPAGRQRHLELGPGHLEDLWGGRLHVPLPSPARLRDRGSAVRRHVHLDWGGLVTGTLTDSSHGILRGKVDSANATDRSCTKGASVTVAREPYSAVGLTIGKTLVGILCQPVPGTNAETTCTNEPGRCLSRGAATTARRTSHPDGHPGAR